MYVKIVFLDYWTWLKNVIKNSEILDILGHD